MRRLRRVHDGELMRVPFRRSGLAVVLTRCCDCGLEHVMGFRVTKRYLGVRAWRRDKRGK